MMNHMNETEMILERTLFSASMLTNQINDLLDLSKLEASKFKFDDEFFDLTSTIEQVFNQVKFLANQKGIILRS